MAKWNINLSSILGIILVLIFAALSYISPASFDAIEREIYDMGSRFTAGEGGGGNNTVLVEIDDKSIGRIGPWPWPRGLFAELIEALDKNEARLICLNIPFEEEETAQGLKELRAFRERLTGYGPGQKDEAFTAWILGNLARMEAALDNDGRLVESVARSGKVILPAFGSLQGHHGRPSKGVDSVVRKNLLSGRNISPSQGKRSATPLLYTPFPRLSQAALGLGHGHLFLGKDKGILSHPMFVTYKGSPFPSFPLRIAMAYLNQDPGKVVVDGDGIRVMDFSIPLRNGEMLIRYENRQDNYPRYSFADILQAPKAIPQLKGRVVLVGFNTRERGGVATPVAPGMSEGELTARIIDNILGRTFISRPPLTAYLELLILLLLGGVVSLFFPRLGHLSRLIWMAGLTALTLVSGMILFSMTHTWFKTIYIAAAVVIIYLAVTITRLFTSESVSKESIETNRLLGLSFQSQGLLDLAFDKFQKLPLDQETKDLIYNLGLDFERKRMINKALTAYEYINKEGVFRDLDDRIPRLKESDQSSTIGSHGAAREASILDEAVPESRAGVGRYEILGELGKGSMGLVYKALDPKINRLLAIKTIRFSDEFDEDVIHEIKERFFREAEIAGQLSHPSIVTIYDVGDDGDLTYMAMEFLEGDDLEKFISRKNLLPFRRVLDIVATVADALEFAHKAEVIHRDIKPANIMLLKTGGVKVTDFGIAKAISSSRTKTGVILGTPNYMSPEQIMGQKIDHRSDIFSLGVLFFQLLTGETPFHGDNLSSLLYQITQVKQPSVRGFNPKVPKVCEQIIDKALAKNPRERFKTAGDMARYVRLLASKIDQLKKERPT
jgi:CHASE2 domain-containing sensor protein/tRNA A-37 threonylcarbamoyl transferase component Bud32